MGTTDSALPRASLSRTVGPADTAAAYASDLPAAAATPFVLGIAEMACHDAVLPSLAPGEVTVGTRAVVEHLAPSPVGAVLTAEATLVRRDGRRLEFVVEVTDGAGRCARIEHVRAVVRSEALDERLAARSGGDAAERGR
ncbi:thioesterase family protein [Nonomuraea lactucae]|uniref:thioesterase family protein n=1 Tax=Nonomuraea lactucae TaxID=2249762 RepID=UPI000DE38823|nr:hotdog domain-containing protein [Nonomuraea lactucae]